MYYYLYCITKALHKPLMNMVGIGNANVHALQYEDIVAILSEVVMAKIPVSNGNVLRHAAVIEAVRKEQSVLPMRYSSVFKNDARVIEFLKNRYAVFVSDLGRLHHKLEMGIRIMQKKVTVHPHLNLPPPPFSPSVRGTGGGIQGNNEYSPPLLGGVRACPVPNTGGGGELLQKKCMQNAEITQSGVEQEFGVSGQSTESPISDPQPPASPAMSYLQQRRIYYASQDENDEWVKEVIKTCHAQFEDICVKHKRDTHTSFSQGVSLNYLIHKDSLNEFKNRFNDLKSSLNELHFLCSGPWPPYHFVSPGDGRE
ncbi:MAG TPA: GvpL/GvpF family gas vesicle protein [Candidatus Wunengus sp. YC65]|uniref:GvpL/GvpF family gas vesicle protein n=1 Tax=Candidatus Wunengus sp. YC65 TaxID=3367701 RepID=UPI004025A2DF